MYLFFKQHILHFLYYDKIHYYYNKLTAFDVNNIHYFIS